MNKYWLFFVAVSFGITVKSFAATPSESDSFSLGDVSDLAIGQSVVGAACGAGFFGFDAEGSILSCVNATWVKMDASYIPGTLCGVYHPTAGRSNCGGGSPLNGCPSGYSRRYYIDTAYQSDYGARGTNVFYCVKT